MDIETRLEDDDEWPRCDVNTVDGCALVIFVDFYGASVTIIANNQTEAMEGEFHWTTEGEHRERLQF